MVKVTQGQKASKMEISMKAIGHNLVIYRVVFVLLLILGAPTFSNIAQDDTDIIPQAAFVTYKCDFQKETNTVRIRAILMGSDGLPIPGDRYTVNVVQSDSIEPLPIERVATTIVSSRPPLQMILVLDITDTVPINNIVSAINDQLAPQLELLDEIALITFADDISDITQFYTNKNRLIHEHMRELGIENGENRLYDSVFEAILELPFNSSMRQIVLVITDSGRKETEQVSAETIIAEANENNIQIFPIGFYSLDKPDAGELTTIANATGGYAWIYGEERNTRALIEEAVGDYLDDFIRTLNSEILMSIDMNGIEADANGRVLFNITIDADDELPLSDQVICQTEDLDHSIVFVDAPTNVFTVNPVDIRVNAESEMQLDGATIVFWVNGEIAQNSSENMYEFDAPNMQPGYYTIGAQLRDRYNLTLATTPTTVELAVQQMLELEVLEENRPELTSITRFEVSANPNITLPAVHFSIASSIDPSKTYQLGDGPVPFAPDNTAVMDVVDMAATIKTLFPDLPEGVSIQIRAFIPSPSEDDFELGTSNNVTFVPAPIQEPEPRFDFNFNPNMQHMILIILATSNLLMFRLVGKMRIRRLIKSPDTHQLSQHLMTITVRQGMKVQSHTLTKKTVSLGRGSSNDINLGDDASISRQHGVILWRKRGWYYSNRKRHLKARIGGKLYKGYVFKKIEPITEIEIGSVQLLFHTNTQRDISEFISTNL
jgi:hypothetical protein